MFRLLRFLVAVICLVVPAKVVDSDLPSDRGYIRSPTNQAIVQSFQQPQNQGADFTSLLTTPTHGDSYNVAIGNGGTSLSSDVDAHVSAIIARNIFHFAHNLGLELSRTYRKTEVFSPLSVMSALALLLLGTKGKSYEELALVFGLHNRDLGANPAKMHEQFGLLLQDVQKQSLAAISPKRRLDPWRDTRAGNMRNNRRTANRPTGHTVELANGIFSQLDYTLNADYRQVVTSVYMSMVQPLDFLRMPAQSRFIINDWVEQRTKGKIPNIIASDIAQNTRVIMASALYFKGYWEQDFFDSATKLDNFYPNGATETPIRVEMMGTGGTFPYYEDQQLDCRIIGLPYRGNMTTMYVIQPMHSTVARLQHFQQSLNADIIENMISKMVRRSALLAFPKLHLIESINMKDMLKRLGITRVFSSVESDLSLMGTAGDVTTSSPVHIDGTIARSLQSLEAQRHTSQSIRPNSVLFVEDIVHKVDFIVNEQGTEAAAATVTYLNKSGPDVLFRAEAPFILLVRHDPTKLILFYGIINEPPSAI